MNTVNGDYGLDHIMARKETVYQTPLSEVSTLHIVDVVVTFGYAYVT